MMKMMETLTRPNLRKLSYNVGTTIIIIGFLLHYSLRFFKIIDNRSNGFILYCITCAGLCMIFGSNTNLEKTYKSFISGCGMIIFAYVFLIYLGDFIFDNWWRTKSIYLIIGTVIICLLWKIYRHFRLRCG